MKDNVESSLEAAMQLSGAIAVMLVDLESGMILGSAGGGLDLDVAAAGNTEVMKSKMRTAELLGLNQSIEDILITLEKQYHILRPISGSTHAMFLYIALDKSKANLAMTRLRIADIEKKLKV